MTQSSVGPVRWTSPESMRERSYSTSSDVFSYGVVLYELFTQVRQDVVCVFNSYDIFSRVNHGLSLIQ